MKKLFLLLPLNLALYTGALNCIAQTYISGGIVTGTWALSGSPYIIQGSIMIPDSATLTIEPGVIVSFQGTYKILVVGQLLAIGTSVDTITFSAPDTTNGWRGIRFDNTPTSNDSSILQFCKFSYGKATGSSPENSGGGIYFYGFSKVRIANSRFFKCTATYGAGIFCTSSSPIITNNIISNNSPSNSFTCEGGGIYCSNSNPTIISNTISNNSASASSNSRGGGIYCSGGSPTIINNTISNNTALYGAGILCTNSNPIITNNIISNNSVFSFGVGGGIYCGNSNPTIFANTIINNTGNNGGGGIFCVIGSSPVIYNNIISNNTTLYIGGGIFCDSSTPTIFNNSISNNTASYGGGGISFNNSSPFISNNIISNNSVINSSGVGGGIYCYGGSSPTIINTTIVNNAASGASGNGGALYCINASNPIFRNSILYGNTAFSGSQVFLSDESSDPNFYYCDVQGETTAFGIGGNFYTGVYQNNIDVNPLFISPSNGSGTGFNGVTADWSLQSGSPCIDSGDPNVIYPVTDKAGNPRVSGCTIDMGTFEYQAVNSLTIITSSVNASTCSANDGSATVNVTGGITPYSYLWSNGDTTFTASGLTTGTYMVTITDANGCIRIDTAIVDCSSDLNLISFQNTLTVYPNPTNGKFAIYLQITINVPANPDIEIYNILGEKTYSTINSQNYNSMYLTKKGALDLIDISFQPAGIYVIQIKSGDKIVHQKLIKQ